MNFEQSKPATDGVGNASASKVVAFDCYEFHTDANKLLKGVNSIDFGSRAGRILAILIERPGSYVSRSELIQAVWPGQAIEDITLRVHVETLRRGFRELGEEAEVILHDENRGFQLAIAGTVDDSPFIAAQTKPPAAALTSKPFSAPLFRVFGREKDIEAISALLFQERLVTVVGPGGIGKTTLARAIASKVSQSFSNRSFFVDLAMIVDPRLVISAIGRALNVEIGAEIHLETLVSHLRGIRSLIVLDNCEHVIDSVTSIAETLLKDLPGLTLLATSHEPLRAEGERVYRVAPLALPGELINPTAAEALAYPAIEMFIDRMASEDQCKRLTQGEIEDIVCICQKLEGIPLAIEIVAPRAEIIGINELAINLDQQLASITNARRTVVDRHRTIHDMLEWTCGNLSEEERSALRKLATFSGPFTMSSALMVAGEKDAPPTAFAETLTSLVRKSLAYASNYRGSVSYRLLESTKRYARDQAKELGEESALKTSHARFALIALHNAVIDWHNTPRREWLSKYLPYLDDVRSAIRWCLDDGGDLATGVRLSVAIAPIALISGNLIEFLEINEKALARIGKLDARELLSEMRLNIAYGYLKPDPIDPTDTSQPGYARAQKIAQDSGKDLYQVETAIPLAGFRLSVGDYPAAVAFAKKALEHAVKLDPLTIIGTKRALALASHLNGEHERAVEMAAEVLAYPITNIPVTLGGIQSDHRISMRIVLARSLWIQGQSDRALEIAKEAVDIAREDGPSSVCQALALALCPVLLWRGDFGEARLRVNLLIELGSRHALDYWKSWGDLFEKVIGLHTGSDRTSELEIISRDKLQTETLVTLNAFRPDDQLDIGAVERGGWAAPELLRAYAERAARAGDQTQADVLFKEAIELAKKQGARAWEAKSVNALAKSSIMVGSDDARPAPQSNHTIVLKDRDSKTYAFSRQILCSIPENEEELEQIEQFDAQARLENVAASPASERPIRSPVRV